jgi:hypothetical protein
MFAVVQNGEIRQFIQPDTAFTIGERQFSARFIRNATEAERKAVGVYEIIYGPRDDERFFWVTGPTYRINEVNQTVEATFTSTPKQLEDKTETPEGATEPITTKGLKSNWIAQTKAAAGSALAQTDWMVIRKAERGVDIPADVAAARAKIVADCATKEAAILAATTVQQLMDVVAPVNIGMPE